MWDGRHGQKRNGARTGGERARGRAGVFGAPGAPKPLAPAR